MEFNEKSFVIFLFVAGAILFCLTVYLNYLFSSKLISFSESFSKNSLYNLCDWEDAEPLLSMPTSEEVCEELMDFEGDSSICLNASREKKSYCEKLFELVEERQEDCSYYSDKENYPDYESVYSQGIPEAVDYCKKMFD